jgi:catechol 2,3-dioxygenase-like lactoylglutathione lyase family enzyme
MDQAVHFVTIATPDLDAARTFYVDGLGWEPHLDVPGEIIFFQIAPGVLLGLFEASKFAADAGSEGANLAIAGFNFSQNVGSPAEVDDQVARWVECGATVTKPAQQSAFGGIYHAQVRDPNGVVWEIAHNPIWRIEADGTVVL